MTDRPDHFADYHTADPLGFDTETELMGPQAIVPRMMCLSTWFADEGCVISNADADREQLEETLSDLLDDELPNVRVAHNLRFDARVIWKFCPDTLPLIFDMIDRGLWQCTAIREKLLAVTTYGEIDFDQPEFDGEGKKITQRPRSYSLAALVERYTGIDIKATKTGEDTWRMNYIALDGVPASEYPKEAYAYALEDSQWAAEVWEHQEARRQHIIVDRGYDPFATLAFRCKLDFCLGLVQTNGIYVDTALKEHMQEELQEQYAADKMTLLTEAGILRPGSPPRPYANGAKNEDGTPKMTAGKKESVNKKKLVAYVEKFCADHNIEPKRTKPTDKMLEKAQALTEESEAAESESEAAKLMAEATALSLGNVSVDKEWLGDWASFDPVLEQYADRQAVQKLISTELPRLEWEGETCPVIYPGFACLKRTGRTSSFGENLFPSFNLQNVHKKARNLFVPRPGHLLLSIDFSAMELGTLAQTCLNVVGYSALADLINAGGDAHAFLGAQLAYYLGVPFRGACEKGELERQQDIYEFFCSFAQGSEEQRKFYKHYRTFAKPTGLGYPGGLGPETFITYAKATYGVDLVKHCGSMSEAIELASSLREVWRNTFPEVKEYHNWINRNAEDPWNSTLDHTKYAYETPLGFVRVGCDYCAAANGMALQSPSAEGMYLAFNQLVQEVYDPTAESELFNQLVPIGPIHDELLADIPAYEDDIETRTAIIKHMEQVMVDRMRQITPDVRASVEPALMRRWDKRAEPIYDDAGNLLVWEPST